MKKCLLWWKKRLGRDLSFYLGWIIALLGFAYIFLAIDTHPTILIFALLLLTGGCFCIVAAFTKEDAPSWRYFSCDEQGNPKVISIESTPEVEKQIELRVTNKQEAQDTLGMIETLHRTDRISNDDYLRVKKQLTEYLKLAEEEDVKTQERESKFMAEEKLTYKAYQRSLLRQLTKLKAAMTEKDYTTAERLINEMIEDTQKNIQD